MDEFVEVFCDEAVDLLTRWESCCLQLDGNASPELWNDLFRVAHNLKGTSRAVGLEALGNFVHKVEDVITQAKSGALVVNKGLITWLLKAQGILSQWTQQLKSGNSDNVPTEEFLLELQTLTAGAGPVAQPVTQAETLAAPVEATPAPEIEKTVSPAPPKAAASAPQHSNASANETVRVSAQKLDQILEMVGELSIHQSIIWHAKDQIEQKNPLVTNSIYLGKKLVRDLYEKALSLRMQPVQPVFQRLERNIRDIAATMGKEVNIRISGGDVELDKTVCEKIIDPLTHMVRNAVDHGVESPEKRESAGKPSAGTIKIEAIQESSSVLLVIQDDGKGLDPQKIFAKALEKGLVKEKDQLSEKEILSLIFLPGFSTAEKVTEVSGRGVGMDVVMRSVEDLHGQVSIGSEVGKGTRFSISLPTSLSIVDALIFLMDGIKFAVPVSAVEEVLNLDDYSMEQGARMLKFRDHVIPVLQLSDYLKFSTSAPSQTKDPKKSAILTRLSGNLLAFKVDEVIGEQQIVVRQLSPGMAGAFGFSGATILGNGEPGLIVDFSAISKKYLGSVRPSEVAA